MSSRVNAYMFTSEHTVTDFVSSRSQMSPPCQEISTAKEVSSRLCSVQAQLFHGFAEACQRPGIGRCWVSSRGFTTFGTDVLSIVQLNHSFPILDCEGFRMICSFILYHFFLGSLLFTTFADWNLVQPMGSGPSFRRGPLPRHRRHDISPLFISVDW